MTDTKAPVIDIQVAVLNWTKSRLLLNASHYPDRKPNRGHLSSKILDHIYDGLKDDVGDLEATNFVTLVYYLEDMTTSVFVEAFKSFWDASCLLLPHQGDGLTDEEDEEPAKTLNIKELSSIIAPSLVHDLEDPSIVHESVIIKGPFLAHHKDEIRLGLFST